MSMSLNKPTAAKSSYDLEQLANHYHKQLREEALFYLQRRGIEPETVEKYRIGFEPGRIGFYVASDKLGDFFENRIILPIENAEGTVVDLIGRSIDNREPKYKSLLGVEDYMFNEEVLEDADDVVLVSGVFDVLSLSQARLPAVCVPVWMMFKESHAEKLKDKRVFICLGNDELGRRESVRIQTMLQSTAKQSFIVNLPESIRDANDFFSRVKNPVETFTQMLGDTMEESLLLPIAPDVKNITVYTEEYMKRHRGQVSGVATGFQRLDDVLFGGLHSGLYLLAGCASSGKTMLMKQMADHIALGGTPVVYVSWDMTAFELWARSIARLIGTEPQKVLGGTVSPDEVNEANKQYIPISKMQWTLECSPDTTMERVLNSIERIAGIAGKTPVVFIDHLNRIPLALGGPVPRVTPAEYQTSLAYALKQWSREWGGPVVAAIPSDIGEERLPEGVEASADVMLLLKSQCASEPPAKVEGHPAALHLMKHRNGPLATVPLRFLDGKARFDELH
ncbi:putative primase-helicase [Paenibacillus mucilaginosus 3016]|uniref:Primase n=2 Tax=Paenibacillus mucilaginosus TaxID=61624 RepID=I0BI51_9BACL|nr:DnaB-like helicase C-terminal domain-containing protein [Paenibacillus mucilaginosus]AFC29863.1 putative primase-helicase [Paenibacillus mucilaginosus 3016]AFH62048.1 primase [Paenibacillus mucilaginosus K02]WFA18528.1 DNA primase [Paenibacillus mucilaginosus]